MVSAGVPWNAGRSFLSVFLSVESSTKLPSLRRQAAQQRRQVLQVPGNQVADISAVLTTCVPPSPIDAGGHGVACRQPDNTWLLLILMAPLSRCMSCLPE